MGEWDSDASNHFTGTMENFVTFMPRRMSVEVADGKFVQATGYGSMAHRLLTTVWYVRRSTYAFQ